jgi:hypothetical protein
MGIHGIRGISKGYSGGLDSLLLYFDKNNGEANRPDNEHMIQE